MAGIFNLFGESDLNKGHVMKPLSRSKTSLAINGASTKTGIPLKQKGLSIRSNSNLNVSATVCNNLNEGVSSKQQEYLKPKLTQLNIDGHPISPRKSMKTSECSSKSNDVSPKNLSDEINIKLQKPLDDSVFKKPLSPKHYKKKRYPEPEVLAPYCDMQLEFDDIYFKTIEDEFKELLMKKKNEVVPYEDEGFESDPELIKYNMPILCISPISSDEEWRQCKTPDLPGISDNDNTFEY